MKIVRFKNGKYGVRRFCSDPFELLSLCPFEFLCRSGRGEVASLSGAKWFLQGNGWCAKDYLDKNDVFDTPEEAQAAYDAYLSVLKTARQIVAAETFDCGSPV